MFGSQALEVAIGLSLMFFILALVATSVTELASRLTKKRSKELAAALDELIGDGSPTLRARETATYKSLCSASGGAPSYMSAKAFGDLVLEILGKAREGANELSELVGNLPSGLQGRIRPLLTSPDRSRVRVS